MKPFVEIKAREDGQVDIVREDGVICATTTAKHANQVVREYLRSPLAIDIEPSRVSNVPIIVEEIA